MVKWMTVCCGPHPVAQLEGVHQQTILGGRCITDIRDECAKNHGGCWHEDHRVGGKTVHFSACHDNIKAVKVQ